MSIVSTEIDGFTSGVLTEFLGRFSTGFCATFGAGSQARGSRYARKKLQRDNFCRL